MFSCCVGTGAAKDDEHSVGIEPAEELLMHCALEELALTESSADLVDEPFACMYSLRQRIIVFRAGVKYNINADPDQFLTDALSQSPVANPRETRRVATWIDDVLRHAFFLDLTDLVCPVLAFDRQWHVRAQMKSSVRAGKPLPQQVQAELFAMASLGSGASVASDGPSTSANAADSSPLRRSYSTTGGLGSTSAAPMFAVAGTTAYKAMVTDTVERLRSTNVAYAAQLTVPLMIPSTTTTVAQGTKASSHRSSRMTSSGESSSTDPQSSNAFYASQQRSTGGAQRSAAATAGSSPIGQTSPGFAGGRRTRQEIAAAARARRARGRGNLRTTPAPVATYSFSESSETDTGDDAPEYTHSRRSAVYSNSSPSSGVPLAPPQAQERSVPIRP